MKYTILGNYKEFRKFVRKIECSKHLLVINNFLFLMDFFNM